MINVTTWSPDTCDCKIEYEWDTEVVQEDRVHTVSRILNVCDAHKDLADDTVKFDQVTDENQRKNFFHKEIMDLPGVTEDVKQPDGSTKKLLKQGLEYKWSFDKDRKLVPELIGFTQAQKDALVTKSVANARLNGKIVIN